MLCDTPVASRLLTTRDIGDIRSIGFAKFSQLCAIKHAGDCILIMCGAWLRCAYVWVFLFWLPQVGNNLRTNCFQMLCATPVASRLLTTRDIGDIRTIGFAKFSQVVEFHFQVILEYLVLQIQGVKYKKAQCKI